MTKSFSIPRYVPGQWVFVIDDDLAVRRGVVCAGMRRAGDPRNFNYSVTIPAGRAVRQHTVIRAEEFMEPAPRPSDADNVVGFNITPTPHLRLVVDNT